MLGLGYLAGMVVALKFGKDGKKKDLNDLSEDFKGVHKNLWTEAEHQIFSPENRERVAEIKSMALVEITEFKKEAEKENKERLFYIELNAKLPVTELLGKKLGIEDAIIGFLNDHVKMLKGPDYDWRDRKSKLE